MANKRLEEVGYRPFDPQPVMQKQILPLEMDNGDMLRRVAAGLARVANDFFERGAREAASRGEQLGDQSALANGPQPSEIAGNDVEAAVPDQKGYRVTVAPGNIRKIIADAASRYGVDADALTEVARIETGGTFNPNAKNPRSTAGGLFQFINSTARQYGLTNKFDASQSADAAARLMRDNASYLKKTLGRDPSAGELYLAHQQGMDGARKLLSNPDALAVDIVGADAVRLNGGRSDMTARQFASLWTSKVHDGGVRMKVEDADGPVKVTPIDSLLSIKTHPGTWKPTRSNTIGGRSYDVSGTKTYLQMAKMAILEDQAKVYDLYKDDPVKLKAAMGQLLEAHRRDGILPEIATEYEMSFRQNAFGLVRQAQADFEVRQRESDVASFNGRVNELENQKSQLLAGLDPKNPEAATLLDDMQRTVDSHYDSAVARGLMSEPKAVEAKAKGRSRMMAAYYLKQTEGLDPAGIEQLGEKMTADYTAGKLAGVQAEEWGEIQSGLKAAYNARVSRDDKASADFRSRADDLVKKVANGDVVMADELAQLQLGAKDVPDGEATVKSLLARVRVADATRKLPVAEAERQLPALLGADATEEDRVAARKLIDSQKERLRTDLVGTAERFGIIPADGGLPLDGTADTNTVAAAMTSRINAANAAAKYFGVSPRYFKPDDVTQLNRLVKENAQQALSVAAGIVSAAGPNADRVLAEIGENAPAIRFSGTILADGGDPQAAADLLAGFGKTPDGKDYPDMPALRRMPLARELSMQALAYTPGEIQNLDSAAAAIARKRLFDAGIDPKSEEAQDVYERAYQEAAGAIFVGEKQYGGFVDYDPGFNWSSRKVLVPNTMSSDQFQEAIDALTDEDLKGLRAKNGDAWTARHFQTAYPVAVNGGYVFARSDPDAGDPQFIADEQGNPIVLDIAGMKRILGSRVPGAYR